MRQRDEKPSTSQSLLLFAIIFAITFSTSVALTSYPQHLALNEKTVIQAVKFIGNNTVLVKGNQVAYGQGDSIPLSGRDYIRITGNQVQIGERNYTEGIRTVSASWHQNVMFTQKIGTFKSNQTAQVVIEKTAFNIVPISSDTFSITTVDVSDMKAISHYNLKFTQDTVYLNENDIMIKLTRKKGTVTASVIGLKKYDNIILRAI